jgi:hypothetical protein
MTVDTNQARREAEWSQLGTYAKLEVLEYVYAETKQALQSERTRADNAFKKFHAREAEIVQIVMDYDGGCDDGKRDFLEELGCEIPEKTVIVNLEFTAGIFADVDDSDHNLSMMASDVAGYLGDDVEVIDYNIDVEES